MKPDASNYNASPEYISGLVEKIQQRHGMTQRAIARQIGVSFTSLRDWQHGRSKWRYPDQLALELLAESQTEIEDMEITQNIDSDALRSAIEAAEENSRINDAAWSDWTDAQHILDTYGISADCAEARAVLDRAIRSNGASLAKDLPAVELAVWGKNFSGSFWDRSE